MNPILFGGTRLMFPALVAAAKTIPASHLARFGLLRGPLIGLGPTVGAFVGGAATVALLVPGTRGWMKERAAQVLQFLKEWNVAAGEEGSSTGESRRKARKGRPPAEAAELA